MDNKVDIKSIEINIGTKTIRLTWDEFISLKTKLEQLFPQSSYYSVPYIPPTTIEPTPWTYPQITWGESTGDSPGWTGTITIS